MFETYRKLLDLMDRRERRRFFLLLGMILVTSFVEMLSIAAILPFLAVVANPEIIDSNRILATIYTTFGFTSKNSFLIAIGTMSFLVLVFGMLFSIFTQYAISRFTAMRGFSIARRLMRGYLRQPYSWYLSQHSANIEATVLMEAPEVCNQCMMPAMRMIAQGAVAFFLVCLLVAAQPMAALAAAVLIGGTYVLIYMVVRKLLMRMGEQRQEATHAKFKIAGEALGGVKDVKLLGLEDAYIRRFDRPVYEEAIAFATMGVVSEMPRDALRAIALGGILFFVVFLLIRGDGNLATVLPILGLYAFAGLRLLPALQAIYYGLTSVRFSQPVLEKIHAEMQAMRPYFAEDATALKGRVEPPAMRLRERLELVGVHYAYPNAERGALVGLDLSIPARTTVGIVGGTGAGKTTAVDLMLGLLRPQQGAVVVDGVPVTDEAVRGWQRSIGYVPQQIFLTDDTVVANIAFGIEPEAIDMAAVQRAARIAELHKFVTQELPLGYQTTLGERGVRLSGGQRQRIGIARALYHDPDVLVLDEATSALDNLTERAVMDAVHNLGHEKTIIMIAHRLSTVRDSDCIFMLEKGRVVARGSYDELSETSAEFRKLVSGGRE